jgi:hypothetical protein
MAGGHKRGALVALVVSQAVLAGGAVAATPKALYHALLTTTLSPSKPIATTFFADSVEATEPSKNSKRHHVVGEVSIRINSGDAEVNYIVFPTHADAVAAWNSAGKIEGQLDSLPLRGFPKPGAIINGSFTNQGTRYGFTDAAFVSGNVLLEAETTSRTTKVSGDVTGAIRLLRWARAHLAAVRARTR